MEKLSQLDILLYARQKVLSDIYEIKLEMETVLDNLMNDITYGSEVLAEHAYNLEKLELDLRFIEVSIDS